MKIISALGSMLVLILAGASFAQPLPQDFIRDVKPLAGYVVRQLDAEYLVDLDAEDGLLVGDILTALSAEEEVVHPVTGEVIGTLDKVKGFLRVVRVKQGYSHVQPMDGPLSLSPGDVVRRYDSFPAKIVLDGKVPGAWRSAIEKALPQLDWKDNAKPLISFRVSTERIELVEPDGTVIRDYALKEDPLLVGSVDGEPGSDQVSTIIRQEGKSPDGVWYGPNMKGAAIAVGTGDFTGHHQSEVAILLDRRVELGRIEQNSYHKIAVYELSGAKPLALDSIDINGDSRDELCLVVADDDSVRSQILAYVDGEIKQIVDETPWHLRKITLPGEGVVLLGQESGKIDLFVGEIFRINYREGRLEKAEALTLPEQVNIYGFAPFLNVHDQLNYAFLSETDYLKVADADGEILWESDDYYGGSEIRVTRRDPSSDDELLKFIRPRVMVNHRGDVLVTWNDGIRLMSRYRAYDESQVVAVRWNGFVMNEQWRTVVQKGYLADFSLADIDHDGMDELITLVKFKRKGLLSGARSGVVVYELQESVPAE